MSDWRKYEGIDFLLYLYLHVVVMLLLFLSVDLPWDGNIKLCSIENSDDVKSYVLNAELCYYYSVVLSKYVELYKNGINPKYNEGCLFLICVCVCVCVYCLCVYMCCLRSETHNNSPMINCNCSVRLFTPGKHEVNKTNRFLHIID